MNVDDIKDFCNVVAKLFLNKSRINGDAATYDVSCLLVELLPFELNWAEGFIYYFINSSFILIEFELVFLHIQTIWQHLLGQSGWLPIEIHDLVLDNDLSLLAVQNLLANSVLLFLRQDKVVFLEPTSPNHFIA